MAAAGRRTWWRRYLDIPLIYKLGVALVLGAVVGLLVGEPASALQPFGDLFLRLLKMLVVPLVVVTLIAGVSSVAPSQLGRIGGKVFGYYLLTSLVAIALGLGLAWLVHPGAGLTMPGGSTQQPEKAPPMAETLLGIVPENPLAAMVEGNVLAVIFFAVIVGIAISVLCGRDDERLSGLGNLLRRANEALVEVVFLLVRGVLEYAPVGVFALIAAVLAETGMEALAPLAKLTGVVYGGVALMIVFYAGLLAVARVGVRKFFGAAKDPMLTAFVTRSSSGTLPVSSRAAERMGVRDSVYSFTLPLGATVNMDGTAIYVGAATVFVADIAGVQLSPGQLLGIVAVGVLASIGTAGVPGAGLIMLSMTISQAGLPFAPVALVAGIDSLLDMVRTMCNVTGDLTGTRLVAKTERDMTSEEEPEHVAAS
ncbi:Na+/H+-dicarboxylate symporter [Saccharopolyspora lacisalsi]|uniref:Na+/H+-dicarboxylate symporter n=1 Tax=Halosaccharopolyspora lacisalsi TaxID=1000566 RepID=A0A839E6E9_9PSEU|nr:dicarboxylate/amino acid:cation symporter [Halosaccharopolyspora lacisalsi]MBA8827455.1 Na+/H+-dicarboxylate symporter [Halosaccharopolyspora lacisalsi]